MVGVAAATMPASGPVAALDAARASAATALCEDAGGYRSRPRNRPGLPTRRDSSC
jgi:hypothetical protein